MTLNLNRSTRPRAALACSLGLGGCLAAIAGCRPAEESPPSEGLSPSSTVSGVPAPGAGLDKSATPPPARGLVLPGPRELASILPEDVRQLLQHRKLSEEDVLGDLVLEPDSVVRTGNTGTARLRQRTDGSCLVRRTPADGWSVWARAREPRTLEKSRSPLVGVPADIASADGLAAWLRADPKRLLGLKASMGGNEIALAALAGVRIDNDDFVALEATAEAVLELPSVSRLVLAALGREIPVVLDLALVADRWEIRSVREAGGQPVAKFLETIIGISKD